MGTLKSNTASKNIYMTLSSNKFAPLYPVIMEVPKNLQRLTGRAKVATLSRLAREALSVSCQKGAWPITDFKKDKKGAPLSQNGHYWSLSHKSQFVAGVAAPYPIGIDIEKVRPCSKPLKHRIANQKEWELGLEIEPDLLFFRFWTAKEAVLKAVGVGINGLSHCRIMKIDDEYRLRLAYRNSIFMVTQIKFRGHLAAVITDNRPIYWTHLLKSI
jgi:4'-phosphopantetheinyl transferase